MYLGIDPHKRCAQVAIIGSEGQAIEEVRAKNVNLDDPTRRYTGSCTVIEATSSCCHVYDTFAEYLDVTITYPGKLTLITHPDKKTDRVDTKELVRLLRLSSIPQSYVLIDEIRQAHALMRERQTLVGDRTRLANRIRGLFVDNSIAREVKPLSVKGREFSWEFSLPSLRDVLLESYLDMVETLTERIAQLEAATEERTKSLRKT